NASHAFDLGLPAELAFGADLASHARNFRSERLQLIHHRVDGLLELEDFAFRVYGDFAREVAISHGGGHVGNVVHLVGQVRGHQIHVVGQILPGARHALHFCLTAELTLCADFAGDACHFRSKSIELIHHGIDRLLELQQFTLDPDGDLAREVSASHGGGDFGDVAHLVGQVGSHGVYVVGQILPGSRHALHLSLAAELAFGADLARNASDFRGEGVELVHHGVNRVFEFQNLPFRFHGNLFGKIALGDGGGDFGDVAHLIGQVGSHGIHVVGQVFPGAGHALHLRLTTELAFRAHFARHARHFGSKRIELVHHRVDGVLELADLTLGFDGNFLREVAFGDGGGDVGNVAHLVGKVARHRVDIVGEVFPSAGYTLHLCL